MCITHRGNKFMEKFVSVAKFIEKEGVIIKHDKV